MSSSLFTRIEKLESRRRTDDQVLLIWLTPGEDVDAAVLAANRGDPSYPATWSFA
jgi:hypothetical protein